MGISLKNKKIERIQNGGKLLRNDDKKMNDVTKDKSIKLTVKVLVPVKDHPKFNFVGKLLGPKGNSLKRLQEETMTKMAILGRGSMRDKQKVSYSQEEELRLSGDQKFNHLSEDLHVEVAALAPPAEAHARIAYALTEIRRYLVPDYNDEIRKEQMREMQMLNTTPTAGGATMTPTTEPSSNNGTLSCASDEGSCSPHSNGGEGFHQSPSHSEGGRGKGHCAPPTSSTSSKGSNGQPSSALAGGSIASPHPALRGLNRAQMSIVNTAGKELSGSSKSRVNSQGRRSVLSLLTKARAIQQKEHEFMGVFHDMSSYNVYDHLGEIPLTENSTEDITGRSGGAIKITPSPTDRARFRHDPYPRIASST